MFWLLADESFPVIKAADDHVSSSTGGGGMCRGDEMLESGPGSQLV